MAMTAYETTVLQAVAHWQAQPPGPATRWFGRAAGPASRAIQQLVPAPLLRGALQRAQRAAQAVSSREALLRRAGAGDLQALRNWPLEVCDRLAGQERSRARWAAATGGAVFGVAGKAGLVLDVPTLVVLALRSIHRIGLCYGEDCLAGGQQGLAIAIFALASANSEEEKLTALEAVRHRWATPQMLDAAWRDGLERAAERELAKEAAAYGLQNLARSLSVQLGWRKAASAAPVIGAVIGASVNAWYLHDVASVAQRCFQERWLLRRHPMLREATQALPEPA